MGKPRMCHSASVVSVTFSPDGNWLASGGFDHTLRIWDAASARVVRAIEEPWEEEEQSSVDSVVFHPSGGLLAYTGPDGEVLMRETATWEELLAAEDPPDSMRLAFS